MDDTRDLSALEERLGYRFREPAILDRALTHRSRANEDATGQHDRQRVARVPRRRGARLRDGRPAVPRLPAVRRGAEVEDQGGAGVDGDARPPGAAARARRVPGARARRGEDGRPGEAGAARRRLRGGHRRHLPRRRDRARPAASCRASSREDLEDVRSPEFWGRDYKSALQELVQSRELPLPEYAVAAESGPDHRKIFHVEVRVRGRGVRERRAGPARRRPSRKPRGRRSRSCDVASSGDRRALGDRPPAPIALERSASRGPARTLHLAPISSAVGGAELAVQPDPQPQQRIAEAVALPVDRHQVHVLQPRQVVLRRARRAARGAARSRSASAAPPPRGSRGSP